MNLPTQNNNPGDLKDPSTGTFQTFNSPSEGKAALYNDLTAKMNGKLSSGSLIDFAKTYAPASDGNDPSQYAANLANKLGVSPDTKLGDLKGRIDDFANAVSQNEGYQSGGNTSNNFVTPPPPTPPRPTPVDTPPPPPSQNPSFGDQMTSRINQGAGAISNALSGKINPASGVLQTIGAVGGAVNDVGNDLLGMIPFAKEFLSNTPLAKGVSALANSGAGQSVASGYQSLPPEWKGNLEAAGNIATALPIGYGIKSGLTSLFGKDALSSIASDVAPNLGVKGTAKDVASQGLVKSFLRGKISQPISPEVKGIAQAVSDNVPGFSKLGTFSDKINAIQKSVYQMADNLKQQVIQTGSDRLYSFKELNSRLKNIEPSIEIKADPILAKKYDLASEAMVKLAQQNGGRISSLFDTRKAFDNLVSRDFPNLYTSQNAPMRSAIKAIRSSVNDFIEERLPQGSGFKDSLHTQSNLFNAIDNLAPKAAKEIGTTRFGRFAGNHPMATGLIKNVGKAAIFGVGAGAAYESANALRGQ